MRINKIIFFLFSLAAVFFILFSTVFAAFPNGSVVIGNTCYSLDYANDSSNTDEIREAVANSNCRIYIKDFDGNWKDNASGKLLRASDIGIQNIRYYDQSYYYYNDSSDHAQTNTTSGSINQR